MVHAAPIVLCVQDLSLWYGRTHPCALNRRLTLYLNGDAVLAVSAFLILRSSVIVGFMRRSNSSLFRAYLLATQT